MAYKFVNPNPLGSYVGDCVIRALSIAMGKTWSETYMDICIHGFLLCDMPSSNYVWGDYLKQNGYKSSFISSECPNCYNVKDFCKDHPLGVYIVGSGNHVLTIINGDYYDSWDSGQERVLFYYTKEE